MNSKRYLITSALPYINGIKHLGNLVGSMLPADVYARYLRQRGAEVLFVCATDEHGTPAELAAHAAGLSVQAYCDQMHAVQSSIYAQFGLSFDYFSRTSSADNHDLTRVIYRQLQAAGFIEKRVTRQLYSVADQRFLPDRYVVGTCPRCGFDGARGDQCEQCASVLEPTDLLHARSSISGSTNLEVRESAHLFLRLAALQPEVAAWVDQHAGAWGDLTASIAHKWLQEGLRDRCITRDLHWGIAVPEPDMADKVFYVWFDAPIGYIAATQDWARQTNNPDQWKSWWLQASDVTYTQFMAKDNVPFHTIMFPAMLLGTRQPWKQPDQIKGFNWLNYYGDKFSTSAHRGVFLDAALELFPADVWRYVLLAIAPESKDGVFTWEEFQQKLNKDLNDNLGNFVNRTLRLAARLGPTIPAGGVPGADEQALEAACCEHVQRLATHLENLEFRKAAETLRDTWTLGNLYIDKRAPWKTITVDPAATALTLRTCINMIALHATLIEPFMPATSALLREVLGLSGAHAAAWTDELSLQQLPAGHAYKVPEPLFRKIDAKEVAALRLRFGAP